MKKVLVSLFLTSLLALPVLGYAQEAYEPTDVPCDVSHDLSRYKGCEDVGIGDTTDKAACCLIDKVLTVGDWIFVAILVVAILVILIAAWTFLTAGGNPDKVASARNYLIFALIGIAVAFLSRVLVSVVASIMA